MIRQRLVAGLVTATALVTLAACGSDKKSSSTTKPVTNEATADTSVASSNPASGVSTPDVSTPDVSTPDVSTPDVSEPDLSIPDISVPDISTPELTGDCVALSKDLPDLSNTNNITGAEVQKAFSTLESKVPADLKDDVTTMQAALKPFYDAVDKAGGDITKAMQDPTLVKEAETAFSDPKFTAASTALDDWFSKGCPS